MSITHWVQAGVEEEEVAEDEGELVLSAEDTQMVTNFIITIIAFNTTLTKSAPSFWALPK